MTITHIPTDEELRRDYDERRGERDLMREQPLTHMDAEEQLNPSAFPREAGVESAAYTKPLIDPQWTVAWKMFADPEGEYGVLVRVPRGQWSGVPDALEHMRRPDGGHWFQLSTPTRVKKGVYACFVGECKKMMHRRIQLVSHVRAFHFEESKTFKDVLERIEKHVAAEDPRLQALLASMELDETGDPAPDELVEIDNDGKVTAVAGVKDTHATAAEDPDIVKFGVTVGCAQCGTEAPHGHADPAAWLVRHTRSAHKESSG